MLRQVLLTLVFIIFLAFTLAIYATPAVVAIPFALVCLWFFCWRKQRAEMAMLLFSLLLLFAGLEIFVRLFADDIFYREHDKWAMRGKYRANVEDSVQARFGDMIAMDPSLEKELAEPHPIVFKTDSLGFRNAQEYADEPYILLGDSFTTTVGSTQSDIIVEQLNALSPSTFYSLAFPGAPRGYEANALNFLEAGHTNARFLWFIFEGNDFNFAEDEGGVASRPVKGFQWKEAFSLRRLPFLTTRVLTIFYKAVRIRLKNMNGPAPVSEISVFPIAEQPMGFFKKYLNVVDEPKLDLVIPGTPEVLERTACVFFIPEKYRVYKPWIKDGPALSEPAAGLTTLKNYFGPRHIPVIDLTPALQKAATRLLPQGKFVFWRDDTHWNAEGIKSILGDVQNCVAKDRAKQK